MKYENVKITDTDHFGRGIVRINNKVVFVNNALKDEIVDIEVYRSSKKFDEAKVIKYITKSKNRIIPKCTYYNECGGCDIMHLPYKKQLKFKKEKIINIFKKYAKISLDIEIIPSKKKFYYRNKITLHYKNNKLGFYKKESHDIIEIEKCAIASSCLNNYLKKIDKFERNIILRCNEGNKVISNFTRRNFVIKTIGNLKFKVNLNSFFQVNDYICEKLFEIIRDNLGNEEIVLDLYSGVGTLSLVASYKAKKVYSIELNRTSYMNALENIKLNNRDNIIAIQGKVEEEVKNFARKCSTIIIDPPRTGLDNFTISFLLNKKPNKIIYVSCDPMSLVRDFNKLKDLYEIKIFKALDMFPQTYHVESVCVLKLK